ncbi:MAG: ABC transporter permease subunit [Xylanivirga thermophila]|jgi:putative aldouronate transport system permease protein|uniref:ABC transporter permease n=2 Tax=Xylanivirga thermophila TaxID=2496273 RepID=UPI0039F53CAC
MESVSIKRGRKISSHQTIKSRKRQDTIQLYLIILPVLIHIFIFHYIPMYGIVIAFQDYFPGNSFISFDGSVKWVGLKHFRKFITGPYFGRLFRNTFTLSFYLFLFGFWVPIVYALLINEVKDSFFKKFVQTASYLPYFISMVVVAGMVVSFINTDGILNSIIKVFGGTPKPFSTDPKYFAKIYTITNIWKSFGWNSILYLSTISGIDPSLYEAARIDGASRFKQALYITIPSIVPTIVILLIFAIGRLLSANTEFILLLYNPAIYERADVIGTYVYREGLMSGNFSSGTAIGLFTSLINFALLYAANAISRKYTEYALW